MFFSSSTTRTFRRIDRELAVLDRVERRRRLLDERGQERRRRRVGQEFLQAVLGRPRLEAQARRDLSARQRSPASRSTRTVSRTTSATWHASAPAVAA
jgi:hypothetical protein